MAIRPEPGLDRRADSRAAVDRAAAPAARPPAPTGLKKYISDKSVFLHWDYSPSDDVDKHQISPAGARRQRLGRLVRVERRDGKRVYGGHQPVRGVRPDQRHQVRVPHPHGGPGGNSKAAKVVATPSAKPAKPEGLRANSGDGLVVLDWDYPYNDDVITDYQYRHEGGEFRLEEVEEDPGQR